VFKTNAKNQILAIVSPIALLCGMTLAAPLAAQTYPTKPVRIIVPFAAGGGADLTARVLAQLLTERVKQSFIVENRVGASGIIATEFVANAAPDGYTLLLGSQTTQAVVPAMYKVSYNTAKDFVGVAEVARSPLFLVVHPSLPVKNVGELIRLAKTRPGQLSFGAASGGTPHMAGELFRLSAGIELLLVPYKGEGPALSDAIGGQISMVFANLPVGLPHAKTGRLRGLAVTSARRVPTAQEYPTVAESGLPGYEAETWNGFFAPAATPRDIVARLQSEVAAVVSNTEAREKMANQGMFLGTSTQEQFAEFVKKEMARWTKVVKDAGIKPQ
jgi:tripartite-type tricarboxylate transporter receptor subunit TctC